MNRIGAGYGRIVDADYESVALIALFWFGGNMVDDRYCWQTGKIMAFLSYLTQVLSSLMMVTMMTMGFYPRQGLPPDRISGSV